MDSSVQGGSSAAGAPPGLDHRVDAGRGKTTGLRPGKSSSRFAYQASRDRPGCRGRTGARNGDEPATIVSPISLTQSRHASVLPAHREVPGMDIMSYVGGICKRGKRGQQRPDMPPPETVNED